VSNWGFITVRSIHSSCCKKRKRTANPCGAPENG